MTYYVQPHVTQFEALDPLRGEACVPASVANGVGATTGGARRPSSTSVHRLIPKAEETNPTTPGWSIVDADRACAKMGIPFAPASGWDALEAAHDAGHYVIVQGDSDRFSDATCSGAFNGDHCIGVHPKAKVELGVEWWWIDDPICKTGRWEKKSTIRAYAEKYNSSVSWGRFEGVVPQVAAPAPPPTVVRRYGGVVSHGRKRVAVPAGRKANVRTRPTTAAGLAKSRSGAPLNGGSNRLPNRTVVEYWQVTKTGQRLAGSRTWYGDRTGTRWVHSTTF